ncbi:MAG: chemotaxis protein CheB [Myxococcota bacterium]
MALEPTRVFVVESSPALRQLVRTLLGRDPSIRVVGQSAGVAEALTQLETLEPDVLTLGTTPVPAGTADPMADLRRRRPGMAVLVVGQSTTRDHLTRMDALGRGAADFVALPVVTTDLDRNGDGLVSRVLSLGRRRTATPATATPPRALVGAPKVLVIGASTGGPDAVAAVMARLPHPLPFPTLVVVHMPPMFTGLFAERLAKSSRRPVVEARNGLVLGPGITVVAPGDHHLAVARTEAEVRARLDRGPPVHSVRPAVDVTLSSVVDAYGGSVLAVILTGIGRDGCEGAGLVHRAGGRVLVQSEATSVVWGMPGSVVDAGYASQVLSPVEIGDAVAARVQLGVGP